MSSQERKICIIINTMGRRDKQLWNEIKIQRFDNSTILYNFIIYNYLRRTLSDLFQQHNVIKFV